MTEQSRRFGWIDGAAIAAALALAWAVHDMALLGITSEPSLAWRLVGPSLAIVAGAALLGGLSGLHRFGPVVVAGAAALAFSLPRFVDVGLASYQLKLPKIALLWIGLALVAVAARRALRLPAWGIAAAAGYAGAAAFLLFRLRTEPSDVAGLLIRFETVGLGVAIGFLAVRAIPARPVRWLLSIMLPLVGVGLFAQACWPQLQPRPTGFRSSAAPAEGPNLLLVTLDTVRADRLAPYGHDRVTMPQLDAFAEARATRYTAARSTTSWTLPSHASLLTGLMPAQHGATHHRARAAASGNVTPARRLFDSAGTLAERLLEQGYTTGAVVSNSAYLQRLYGLHRGFQHYDDRAGVRLQPYRITLAQMFGWKPEFAALAYRDARSMTDLALRWLEGRERRRPFFLFVNYMDAHYPYLPPARYARTFDGPRPRDPLKPEAEHLPHQYDRELLFLDHHLGRLLAALEQRGELDDTVVIITSDHGEAFGEHGFWMHGRTLYEEVVRVPLYIKPAGPRERRADPSPVNGAHVYHIALQLLGLESDKPWPSTRLIGEWYQSDKHKSGQQPEPIDRDLFGWLEGDRKIIASSKGRVRAFDLTRDPAESQPLPLQPEEQELLLQFARNWWLAHPPVAGDDAEATDPEVLQRLRALGYID